MELKLYTLQSPIQVMLLVQSSSMFKNYFHPYLYLFNKRNLQVFYCSVSKFFNLGYPQYPLLIANFNSSILRFQAQFLVIIQNSNESKFYPGLILFLNPDLCLDYLHSFIHKLGFPILTQVVLLQNPDITTCLTTARYTFHLAPSTSKNPW